MKDWLFFKLLLVIETLCTMVYSEPAADLNFSFLCFRQKFYRLETLVQSSSHDFGKLVLFVVHSLANNHNNG